MNSLTRDYVSIILENKRVLAQDILHDIIENLREDKVLTPDDLDVIMGDEYVPIKDFHIVAGRLLDVIITKPPVDIEKFVSSLRTDYSWLYNLFPTKDNTAQDALIVGGVPVIPKRHATRTDIIKEVKSELFKLERGNYLALHGMAGSGKTTLAAESLYDQKLLQTFHNKVLWVSTSNAADLSSLQLEINNMLPDPVAELTGNVDQDVLLLRKQLSGKPYLLILDDVPNKKVLEALNIGCKILITTKEPNILDDYSSKSKFIEVSPSFKLEETLDVFGQALGVTGDELPHDAHIIHNLTRGFPLSVSLLGGYIEDNKEWALTKDKNLWSKLTNLLKDKNYGGIRKIGLVSKVWDVIGISVRSLDDSLKSYFNDFALFLEDINIKPEVLCVLWNLSDLEVGNLLMQFVRKSLLVRKWVPSNGSPEIGGYVYGIHDSVLSYLKESLNKDQEKALHKKLIDQYRNKCPGKDFSKLPRNDNYIFIYLGHHLKKAGELDEFPNLYANLEFIEAKLQTVGPAELLSDYANYQNEITAGQDFMFSIVREIQYLIECCGQNMYLNAKHGGSPPIDIVHCIFRVMSPLSPLYKNALRLASARPNMSYIRFPLGLNAKGNYPSKILPQQRRVSCIKCTNKPMFALIGYENGALILWNIKVNTVVYNYAGHYGSVQSLAVNNDSSYFLSYGRDKTIQVWPLFSGADQETFMFGDLPDGPRTPSPSRIQENHSPMWPNPKGIPSAFTHKHKSQVVCAVYGLNITNMMASVTQNTITLWRQEVKKDLVQEWSKKVASDIWSCVFCRQDSILLIGFTSTISAFASSNGAQLFQFDSNSSTPVLQLITNPDDSNEVLMRTENQICSWTFNMTDQEPKLYMKKTDQNFILVDIMKFIAIAYSDSDIEIYNKLTNESLGVLHKPNSRLYCVGLSNDELLAAYNDNTVCIWPLAQLSKNVESVHQPPHCIVWINDVAFVASYSNNNSILVRKERDLLFELPQPEAIALIAMSPDAKMIAFVDRKCKLTRCYISQRPNPSSYHFNDAPTFVNVYLHNNKYVVLAAPQKGQLLVWQEDKMTFFCDPDSIIQRAFLCGDHIIVVLTDNSVKLFSLEGHSAPKDLIKGSQDTEVTCCEMSSKNNLAIATRQASSSQSTVTIYKDVEMETALVETFPHVCTNLTFAPNGFSFAAMFENQAVMIYNFLNNTKKEVVGIGDIAVSCSGALCLRNKSLVRIVSPVSMTDASAPLSSPPKPLVSASPHSNRFATLDSSGAVHTFLLFP